MSITQAFTANIRGLPHNPSVTEINTRAGAGTTYGNPFKARVGLKGLPVLEVKADEGGVAFQGKVYQWFRLQFPDGKPPGCAMTCWKWWGTARRSATTT